MASLQSNESAVDDHKTSHTTVVPAEHSSTRPFRSENPAFSMITDIHLYTPKDGTPHLHFGSSCANCLCTLGCTYSVGVSACTAGIMHVLSFVYRCSRSTDQTSRGNFMVVLRFCSFHQNFVPVEQKLPGIHYSRFLKNCKTLQTYILLPFFCRDQLTQVILLHQ